MSEFSHQYPWMPLVALTLAAACAAKTSIPAGESDVDIKAGTTIATSDVKYIEIIVHDLLSGALVYDSGIQPSSSFQDTRQHLEEHVPLAGATDFLFDAKAFDVNKVFLKDGNTVQAATQPAGEPTSVLIVIDLNSGNTNPTSPGDITAVTDNIPVLEPPTLSIDPSTSTYTLHTKASDLDQDTDAGAPIDSSETLTYFTAVLAGNVSGPTALFTEGQDFAFTFNDSQPVKILSCVVDRLNQLTFAITDLDPTTGMFQVVEFGEGYALFDGNTFIPSPRRHERSTGDPTGPRSGDIAVVVLKHMTPAASGPPTSAPPSPSVEAITRSDDSLVVTPNNVAYWNTAVVASFNRYEEQPDANGNIVIDFKLRVLMTPPPGTTFVNDPPPSAIDDAIKFASDNDGHFVFAAEIAEQATLPTPVIATMSGGSAAGATVELDGSWFDGSYQVPSALDTNPGHDQRQVYLQDTSDPTHFVYPDALALPSGGSSSTVTFQIPMNAALGIYDVVLCTYGRNCTRQAGAISVMAAIGCLPSHEFNQLRAADQGFDSTSAIDVALDGEGDYYVLDFNHELTKVDANLNPLWISAGWNGLATVVGPGDVLYFGDMSNPGTGALIVVDETTGDPIDSQSLLDLSGAATITPYSLAFDSAGSLYVMDGLAHNLSKHHYDGATDSWIADWVTFTSNGSYGLAVAENLDRIFITDRDAQVLTVVQLSTGIDLGDVSISSFLPWGLAYDAGLSRLYVAAYAEAAVLAFNAASLIPGNDLPAEIGDIMSPEGFPGPVSVRLDPITGQMVVADGTGVGLFGCPVTSDRSIDSVVTDDSNEAEMWILGTDLDPGAGNRTMTLIDETTSPTVTFQFSNIADLGGMGGEIDARIAQDDALIIDNRTYTLEVAYDDGAVIDQQVCFNAARDATGACASPEGTALFLARGEPSAQATAINDYGSIVGDLTAGSMVQAVLWRDHGGLPQSLPAPSADHPMTDARAIDDEWEVIGLAYKADFSDPQPVVWVNALQTSTPPVFLPYPADAEYAIPRGIGAGDNVVGEYIDASGNEHALLWATTPPSRSFPSYQEFRTPAGQWSVANADDGANEVVGIVNGHAAEWIDISALPIMLPEPANMNAASSAVAINGPGVSVGWVYDASGDQAAAVWQQVGASRQVTVLPAPSTAMTAYSATGINSLNQIVGTGQDPSASKHYPLMWIPDGAGGWTLHALPGGGNLRGEADGINNHESIVGQIENVGDGQPELWRPAL